MRYLLLWIALEALFGADSEITFRISQRIAFFISGQAEAKETFRRMKRAYNWRNKIVHGLRHRELKREESEQVLHDTETAIRKALRRILLDAAMVGNFVDNRREPYLDELAYQPSAVPAQ